MNEEQGTHHLHIVQTRAGTLKEPKEATVPGNGKLLRAEFLAGRYVLIYEAEVDAPVQSINIATLKDGERFNPSEVEVLGTVFHPARHSFMLLVQVL